MLIVTFVVMLSAVMLGAVMLNVIMLSVVILNVVAPLAATFKVLLVVEWVPNVETEPRQNDE
jgi:hypothetical protein